MIIRHIGHAEFLIETESGMRIVMDPYDAGTGYPVQKIRADVALISHEHHDHNAVDNLEGLTLTIREPGIYTAAKDVRITALRSFHDETQGSERGETLLFLTEADGLRVVHLGDLGCFPDEGQIRELAQPDVLMIPVGGFYTIDGRKAREITEILRPAVTLPMHYKTMYNADWPICGPEEFLEGIPEKDIRRDIEVLRITKADRECQPRVALFRA